MPVREGCSVSAESADTALNRRTNEFLCFLTVSPSVIAATPAMPVCSRHLLPAGTVSRAASPGGAALLLCTWPVAGKKREKEWLWGLQRATARAASCVPRPGALGVAAGAPYEPIYSCGKQGGKSLTSVGQSLGPAGPRARVLAQATLSPADGKSSELCLG